MPSVTASVLMNRLPTGHRLHWYEIDTVIGSGGFGVTYCARDLNLDQLVAIKEFFPSGHAKRGADGKVVLDRHGDPEVYAWGMRRFIEEAQALARLGHPNIVQVFSVFETNGSAYMAMRFEKGETLEERIRRRWEPGEEELMPLVGGLLDGLASVHGAGFIHRDIKPANVIVRDGGTPVLIDFGAARQTVKAPGHALTVIVTRGYAPFEQYDENASADQGPWTDIYGLAATLYRIVTGKEPTESLNRATALLEGRPDPLVPARELAHGRYSEELLAAIDRGLEFRVEDRPRAVESWRRLFPIEAVTPQAKTRVIDTPTQVEVPDSRDLETGEARRKYGEASSRSPCQAAPDSAHPSAGSTRELADLTVLTVDDEPFMRQIIVKMLNNLNVTDVASTDGGEAALRHLDEVGVPDVIFCDLNMPGMDGLELMRHLGERRVGSAIAFLSGEDEQILKIAENLARSYRLYVLGALKKPPKPQQLARLLECVDVAPTEVRQDYLEPLGEQEIRDGLARGDVEVHYQPKVGLANGEVRALEALARWRHPKRGLLGPAVFLPGAERAGLENQLADAIFCQAVAATGSWHAAGFAVGISVNFSADTLSRTDLPRWIVETAALEGLAASHITLEVMENRVLQDRRVPVEVLARLRMKGLRLALDDFGTGLSTLEQLKQIPFTEIKVDRAFVTGVRDEDSTRALLESSVMIGKRLSMTIVAEGIESDEDLALVRSIGCDEAQGYFIARPMPEHEVLGWLSQWDSRRHELWPERAEHPVVTPVDP